MTEAAGVEIDPKLKARRAAMLASQSKGPCEETLKRVARLQISNKKHTNAQTAACVDAKNYMTRNSSLLASGYNRSEHLGLRQAIETAAHIIDVGTIPTISANGDLVNGSPREPVVVTKSQPILTISKSQNK